MASHCLLRNRNLSVFARIHWESGVNSLHCWFRGIAFFDARPARNRARDFRLHCWSNFIGMNERLAQPTMITAIALATEGGLIALALLIASWWGHNPWGTLSWAPEAFEANLRAVGQGALAALPLFVGLIFFDRFPILFFRTLKDSVEREVVPLFAHATIGEFALISIAAGFGEELFFRGLLQSGLAEELAGPYRLILAVGIASVVFGVCHWLNSAYALMATLTGIYLGALLLATENLLAPIAAHALYDFLALCYLVTWKRWRRQTRRSGAR